MGVGSVPMAGKLASVSHVRHGSLGLLLFSSFLTHLFRRKLGRLSHAIQRDDTCRAGTLQRSVSPYKWFTCVSLGHGLLIYSEITKKAGTGLIVGNRIGCVQTCLHRPEHLRKHRQRRASLAMSCTSTFRTRSAGYLSH